MNVNGPLFPPGVQAALSMPAARPARAAGVPGNVVPERETPAAAAGAAPTLWDVLTEEEREFFAQQTAIGPLTYGPGSARTETPRAPTGQRIDRTG